MKIGKYEFPDDLYYDATHNWARVEAGEVVQGMSAFGQALAGEIVYVEPAAFGREVAQGAPMFSIESGKWVGRINATVSGEVLAFNHELEWEPERVNRDPYGRGWMVRIRPASLEEDLARLLRPDTDEFRAFIAAEREKYGL
ncbi:MAG: glycine cleavage system protein H [Anaerolineae bacterium]|nr:glycine cleavage system protein H [Anaerolineae bacterium]